MESHQPYLSFLFRNILTKQENFTFLPDKLPSLSITPMFKSSTKEVP